MSVPEAWRDRPMPTLAELALYLGGSDDSFTGHLLRLMCKADAGKRSRLATAFPVESRALQAWTQLEGPTMGALEDLALGARPAGAAASSARVRAPGLQLHALPDVRRMSYSGELGPGACSVYVPGRQFAQCGYPAVAIARAGCIHEHIVEREVCEDHKQITGAAGCMRCLTDAVNPHDCPMAGELLELTR